MVLSARTLVVASLLVPRVVFAACGDGAIDGTEECDDGDADSGDGCSASCTVEPGYDCQDATFSLDFNEAITNGPIHGTSVNPNWTLSNNDRTVSQSVNSAAGVYMSTLPATGGRIAMDIEVTGSDNDYFGFVIGYQAGEATEADADWLLFDWKGGDQTEQGCLGQGGMALNRINGPLTSDVELWCHNGAVETLSRGLQSGTTGWVANRVYRVEVEYSTTSLRIYVDGVREFDEVGQFPSGNIGFYNFSQPSTRFSLISPEEGLSVCGALDTDEDGLTDPVELEIGTEIDNPDTDGDGLSDGEEYNELGTDPLKVEQQAGVHPFADAIAEDHANRVGLDNRGLDNLLDDHFEEARRTKMSNISEQKAADDGQADGAQTEEAPKKEAGIWKCLDELNQVMDLLSWHDHYLDDEAVFEDHERPPAAATAGAESAPMACIAPRNRRRPSSEP